MATLVDKFPMKLSVIYLLLLLAPTAVAETQIVRCTATTGEFVIEVYPEWAPLGAARFLELVKDGFFTNSPLFRVVPGFLVQFGIGETPEITNKWKAKGKIKDDPNIGTPVNRGTVAFAGGGMDSRTTEMWISYKDSKHLGKAPWETPFGQIVQGMEAVDAFYSGYGDMKAFKGNAPDQQRLYKEGISYTKKEYPELSYILSCELDHEPLLADIAIGHSKGAEPKALDSATGKEAEGVIWEPAGHEAEAEERILNAAVPGAVIHDDLHQFSISLRTSPTTPKRGSVLGSTQGLLLISAVVAFVVGCVRYGGDQVIRGKGGILDGVKDR